MVVRLTDEYQSYIINKKGDKSIVMKKFPSDDLKFHAVYFHCFARMKHMSNFIYELRPFKMSQYSVIQYLNIICPKYKVCGKE